MNDNSVDNISKALLQQSQRLQELMVEMTHCCQERLHLQARRFKLREAEFRCLLLFDQERYCTGKGAAAKLGVSKSRATIILDGLLRKGLLSRTEDPNDARVRLFGLTAAGGERLSQMQDFLRQSHQDLLTTIHQAQRDEVLASLETLRTSMRRIKLRCAGQDQDEPTDESEATNQGGESPRRAER
jgi:DNA-binding MarR family transcriptional regulator